MFSKIFQKVEIIMLRWNILQYLTKIMRQYANCNEILEMFLTSFCNILCYVGIKRLFQRNKLLYIILKGVLLPNTWASQQQKYLKHGGREPVASNNMTLGQVVPNFTGPFVSSKILQIFRWKLRVTLCGVSLSKWP